MSNFASYVILLVGYVLWYFNWGFLFEMLTDALTT
jgi:hypothetical protein